MAQAITLKQRWEFLMARAISRTERWEFLMARAIARGKRFLAQESFPTRPKQGSETLPWSVSRVPTRHPDPWPGPRIVSFISFISFKSGNVAPASRQRQVASMQFGRKKPRPPPNGLREAMCVTSRARAVRKCRTVRRDRRRRPPLIHSPPESPASAFLTLQRSAARSVAGQLRARIQWGVPGRHDAAFASPKR